MAIYHLSAAPSEIKWHKESGDRRAKHRRRQEVKNVNEGKRTAVDIHDQRKAKPSAYKHFLKGRRRQARAKSKDLLASRYVKMAMKRQFHKRYGIIIIALAR